MIFLADHENDLDSHQALLELENIDDECDNHGIAFVKIHNEMEAAEYGIEKFPTLVYFEKSVPSLYTGMRINVGLHLGL